MLQAASSNPRSPGGCRCRINWSTNPLAERSGPSPTSAFVTAVMFEYLRAKIIFNMKREKCSILCIMLQETHSTLAQRTHPRMRSAGTSCVHLERLGTFAANSFRAFWASCRDTRMTSIPWVCNSEVGKRSIRTRMIKKQTTTTTAVAHSVPNRRSFTSAPMI